MQRVPFIFRSQNRGRPTTNEYDLYFGAETPEGDDYSASAGKYASSESASQRQCSAIYSAEYIGQSADFSPFRAFRECICREHMVPKSSSFVIKIEEKSHDARDNNNRFATSRNPTIVPFPSPLQTRQTPNLKMKTCTMYISESKASNIYHY